MHPQIAADLRQCDSRIYVRAQTDPQSAQLWWPGRGAACLAGPGRTDRRTDGRIAASINAHLWWGHNNGCSEKNW